MLNCCWPERSGEVLDVYRRSLRQGYKDRYGYNASFYTILKLLKHEINLRCTYRLSSYLKANTMNLHFKFQLVKADYENNNYSLARITQNVLSSVCGEMQRGFDVKAGDIIQ